MKFEFFMVVKMSVVVVLVCGTMCIHRYHTIISEKLTVSIFRPEVGCWEVDSLYRVIGTSFGGIWPTRATELGGGVMVWSNRSCHAGKQ